MRDHIYHMEVMLAGLWGGVSGNLPNVRELANTALGYTRNRWNDQEFFARCDLANDPKSGVRSRQRIPISWCG